MKVRLTEERLRGLIYEEVRRALYEGVNSRDVKEAIMSSVDSLARTGHVTIPLGDAEMDVRLNGDEAIVSVNGKTEKARIRNIDSRNDVVNAVYMAFVFAYGF